MYIKSTLQNQINSNHMKSKETILSPNQIKSKSVLKMSNSNQMKSCHYIPQIISNPNQIII